MIDRLWIVNVAVRIGDRYTVGSVAYAKNECEALSHADYLAAAMIGKGNDVVVRVMPVEFDS